MAKEKKLGATAASAPEVTPTPAVEAPKPLGFLGRKPHFRKIVKLVPVTVNGRSLTQVHQLDAQGREFTELLTDAELTAQRSF